jgi:hypothetical protein
MDISNWHRSGAVRLTAFVRLFGGEQLIHLNAADLEDLAE